MTNELLTLIVMHFACAELASERPLSQGEVETCGAVYETIKLAFVPGVSHADYRTLVLEDRIAVSQAGFLAFLEWRKSNPDLVHHLESVARGEAQLETAG